MDNTSNLDSNSCVMVDCGPAPPAAGADPANTGPEPTQEENARMAHSLWESRVLAGQEGSANDDWLRAEETLRQREPAFVDC